NRIPKTAIATAPRIAIRNANCGVSRNGSATRGSRGRKVRGSPAPVRARTPVLAKQPHLLEAACGRAEEAAAERVDRQRKDQVEEELERQRVDEHALRRGGVAEHVVEDERADRVEDRDQIGR